MLCRATQDRWVMVESSDKTWSTGEGNGKPLQYSCLENPINSMKKQNDRRLKEESEKIDLKLNIQKTNIMASGHIISWQVDGETVADFIFWGSKMTADGDCSHKIKRHLLLGRKVMTNLDSIFKSRDITLSTKVHLSRLWFFQ